MSYSCEENMTNWKALVSVTILLSTIGVGQANSPVLSKDIKPQIDLNLSELFTIKQNPAAPNRPIIISAIIQVESKGNPKAVSHRGAMGLMQIMPEIAEKFNVDNPFDPKQNIAAGKRLFKEELKRFNGDYLLALSAYNAGSPKVLKAIKKAKSRNYLDVYPHLPKETRNYVPKVLKEVVQVALRTYTIEFTKG